MLCDTSCGKEIYCHRNNKQYDFLSKKTYVDEIEIVFCNIFDSFKNTNVMSPFIVYPK